MLRPFAICVTCGLLVGLTGDAYAQTSNYTDWQLTSLRRQNSASRFSTERFAAQAYRGALPRYNSIPNINVDVFSSNRRRPEKPFSNVNVGPSVTPYLNLGGFPVGGVDNYYSLVRPQLEQQRINERNRQLQVRQQQQLQQVAARAPYDVRGDETVTATGHPSVFLNTLGYFPQSDR